MAMKKIEGVFCERKVAPKTRFDRRSFRYVKSGQSWILVGCPKGKWNAKAKRCKVGTRAHKILARSVKGKSCPTGKRISK